MRVRVIRVRAIRRATEVLLLTAALAGCAARPITAPAPGYTNPVLNRDFPDPAVLRTPDDGYYAYATGSTAGDRTLNVPVARSEDLVSWELLGDALPSKPVWARAKQNQNFWAPHVIRDPSQDKYFMYYSAEPDAGTGKCLAVATAARPAGPFVDSGRPLLCGEGIEHIDPMAFDDPQTGKRLLYWGSGGKPLKVQELAADRLGFLPGSAPKDILLPDAGKDYSSLIEGAWVIFRRGDYFLFYSGDRCCAKEPRYAVMVARSYDAFGPFEPLSSAERGSSAILVRGTRWLAPGHNSVITDDDGVDWMLYHATDTERPQNGRALMLDRIVYRDGWPRINSGEPSTVNDVAPGRTPISATSGKHDKLAQ
jgi:arabinan endo-1,5-alpha-L-arabinosidase